VAIAEGVRVSLDDEPRVPSSGGERPIRWYQRRWVHLAFGLLVAVLGVTWAGQRATEGVRTNLDARLVSAGAGADAALVVLEGEQLSALRAVSFTEGVGQAMAARDPATLNRLVAPLHANSNVSMVDLVLPNGTVEFAVRTQGAPRPVASRAGLRAITEALERRNGVRGGRFTELDVFKSGPALVTAGPVLDGTTPVGVVLVMTPLADALGRISQEVGTDLNVYDGRGTPLATTALFDPKPVNSDDAKTLMGGGAIQMRYVHGKQREALGRLILDHQSDAVLGASLYDNSPATGRAVTIYAALGLLCTMLILWSFWIRFAGRRRQQ
jgi:hypothetical protein